MEWIIIGLLILIYVALLQIGSSIKSLVSSGYNNTSIEEVRGVGVNPPPNTPSPGIPGSRSVNPIRDKRPGPPPSQVYDPHKVLGKYKTNHRRR